MERDAMKNDPLFNLIEIVKVRKFKMILVFLIVLVMTAVGAFVIMPSVYEANTKVGLSLPALPKGADVVPYLEELRDIKSFVADQPLVASGKVIYEKAAIALNLHKMEKGRSFLGRLKNLFFKEKEKDPLVEAIDELYKITNVSVIRGTYIIQFSARSGSPEAAAQIANTLAKTYIDHENGLMASRAQMAYDIISGELESARDSFTKSQAALNGLKRGLNVYDDPALMKKNLSDYRIKYEQMQEAIQTLESQPPTPKTVVVKKAKPQVRQAQPTDSPKVKELKAKLTNLKNELEVDSKRYTEQHPTIKRLQSRIAILEEELAREEKASPPASPQPIVETELDTPAEQAVVAAPDIKDLKRRKDNMSKQIQTLEGKLSRASLMGIEGERLIRDTNQKELEYIAAKEKLEHARVLRDQTREGPIKIIDPATPPAHAAMKKKVILFIVGLMASIVFGIAVGFIAEYFEDVYKSPEEVEKSLNLPVLATIPRIPKMMGNGKSRLRFPLNRSKRDDGSDRQEMRM